MSGWTDADLSALRQKTTSLELTEARIAADVRWLRKHGCPWSLIGEALGITRQAAQQRFTPKPAGRLEPAAEQTAPMF